ncbi:MAG: SDR family oxidoreductase [Nocardioidaceae bacterium]|nr:SDR family oxidoreductase [Nocardioidaceae bacterium]NUS52454.1 SDR family oxidoreductase [Nocardioidaceae bacterium]
MSNPVIVVVGAGPGLGASVARRFGRDGYDVALLSLDEEELKGLGEQLQADGITTGWTALDITDAGALTEAVTRFGGHAGRLDVLHFNPSVFRQRDPLHLSPAELLTDVGVGVAPLLTALQAARPFMSAGGRVTATGSMAADQPWHEAPSLGVQKAGLRNLVHSIDATLRPDGIRAVSVTVNGTLSRGGPFDPDRVADAIHAAAHQPEESWRSELPYDG